MEPIQEKEGAYIVVGGKENGQPEYFPLEVTRHPDGTLWSAWKPSKEDLKLLNEGNLLRIGLLTVKQPPIIVEVRPIEKKYGCRIPLNADVTDADKCGRGTKGCSGHD